MSFSSRAFCPLGLALASCLSLPSAHPPSCTPQTAAAALPPPPPPTYTPLDFSRSKLDHHLLHASLSGPGMLEHYSLSLSSDKRSLRGALTLGKRACGHPQYIHGGAIAAILDDCMGVLFLSSGEGTGFTANLTVNYRRPIPASAPLRVEVSITHIEVGKSGAKKVLLVGRLLSQAGGAQEVLYAEATSIFIVKHIAGMVSKEALLGSIQSALGLK